MKLITHSKIKQLFGYADNGTLVRKCSTSNVCAGTTAGYSHGNGYVYISIADKNYLAHRLIWLWHHGYMPEGELDHINKLKHDNRIDNLREVSRWCNRRNTGNTKANTSGVKGISWDRQGMCWSAYVYLDSKLRKIGKHCSFDEAVLHRLAAEQCLNWEGCDSSSPAYMYAVGNGLICDKQV